MKKTKTIKKFMVGGKVGNAITNPSTELAKLDINKANAMSEANTDFLGNMFGVLAQVAPAAMGMIDWGQAGESMGFGVDWSNTTFGPGATVEKAQYGGKTGLPSIEVEGKEMFETPDGQIGEFKGKSHKQGGIKLKVKGKGEAQDGEIPAGTDIYSNDKSIKIDGKTPAERKKIRTLKEKKISELLENGSSDIALKNTRDRIKSNNSVEDLLDRTVQDMVRFNKESKTKKFQSGGTVPYLVGKYNNGEPLLNDPLQSLKYMVDPITGIPMFTNLIGTQPLNPESTTNTTQTSTPVVSKNTTVSSNGGLPTVGDSLGIFGNLFQGIAPLQNTLRSRATDTPNTNEYLNYGQNSLKTLRASRENLKSMEDNALNDLELTRNAMLDRNRNSSRSVSSMMASNLASDQILNKNRGDIMSEFANQMMQALNIQAQTESDIDRVVMGGEQAKDLADRQDKDAFYTQLSKDYSSLGESISRTGKSVNEIKARGVQEKFMNMLYDFVDGNIMNGTVKQKAGALMQGKSAEKQFNDWLTTNKYDITKLDQADLDKLRVQWFKSLGI